MDEKTIFNNHPTRPPPENQKALCGNSHTSSLLQNWEKVGKRSAFSYLFPVKKQPSPPPLFLRIKIKNTNLYLVGGMIFTCNPGRVINCNKQLIIEFIELPKCYIRMNIIV